MLKCLGSHANKAFEKHQSWSETCFPYIKIIRRLQIPLFALCDVSHSQVCKAAGILTTQFLVKILRSKEAAATVNTKTWPIIIDTGTTPAHTQTWAETVGIVCMCHFLSFKKESRKYLFLEEP